MTDTASSTIIAEFLHKELPLTCNINYKVVENRIIVSILNMSLVNEIKSDLSGKIKIKGEVYTGLTGLNKYKNFEIDYIEWNIPKGEALWSKEIDMSTICGPNGLIRAELDVVFEPFFDGFFYYKIGTINNILTEPEPGTGLDPIPNPGQNLDTGFDPAPM